MHTSLSVLPRVLLTLSVGLWITACGGGGSGEGTAPPASSANKAPTIQGQPPATVGPMQSYTFQPTARDTDGSALSFSAENLPAWLTLDGSTGRLYGTPSAADVGTYAGITIAVSDGRSAARLGPFSISVTDVGSGSATLSWSAPTQNSDGTPLLNLAGYEIRYGLSRDDMSMVVSLPNPSLDIYVIENLTSGTWYFAVAALNSTGVTSPLSDIASKTIG